MDPFVSKQQQQPLVSFLLSSLLSYLLPVTTTSTASGPSNHSSELICQTAADLGDNKLHQTPTSGFLCTLVPKTPPEILSPTQDTTATYPDDDIFSLIIFTCFLLIFSQALLILSKTISAQIKSFLTFFIQKLRLQCLVFCDSRLSSRCSSPADHPLNWNLEKMVRYLCHACLFMKDNAEEQDAIGRQMKQKLNNLSEVRRPHWPFAFLSVEVHQRSRFDRTNDSRNAAEHYLANLEDLLLTPSQQNDLSSPTFHLWCQRLLEQDEPDLFHCCLIVTALELPEDHFFWTLEEGGYRQAYDLFHDSHVSCFAAAAAGNPRPPSPLLFLISRVVAYLMAVISLFPVSSVPIISQPEPDCLPPNSEGLSLATKFGQSSCPVNIEPPDDSLLLPTLLLSLGLLLSIVLLNDSLSVLDAASRICFQLWNLTLSFVRDRQPPLPAPTPASLLAPAPFPAPTPASLLAPAPLLPLENYQNLNDDHRHRHWNCFGWDVEKIGRFLVRLHDLLRNETSRQVLTDALNEHRVPLGDIPEPVDPRLAGRTTALKLKAVRDMLVHWSDPGRADYVRRHQTAAEFCASLLDTYPDLFVWCQVVAASELPENHVFWAFEGGDYLVIYHFHHGTGR
jgi:hypothetical protein